MLNGDRHRVTSSMIAQIYAMRSEGFLSWLPLTNLTADASNPALGEFAIRNGRKQTIFRDLLQAACLGADVHVPTHLVRHLFPNLLETTHNRATRKNSRPFVRLAIEVASEERDRAIAFERESPNFGHNLGILIQFPGFCAPSTFCLRRATRLQPPEESSPSPIVNSQLNLLRAQYFLASCFRELTDWSVAD